MTKRQRENARHRLEEDIRAAVEHGVLEVTAGLLVGQEDPVRARNLAKIRGDLARSIITELKRHFSITRRKA